MEMPIYHDRVTPGPNNLPSCAYNVVSSTQGYKQYEHCNIGAANFAHSLADKPKQMPKRLANTIFTSCASTLPKCSPSIDVLHTGHIKEHFSGDADDTRILNVKKNEC
ncbi:CREB-binding protein -like [Oryza sativa Japonica Group]|uniref:CREB-binding protein-like n=1 Tax=Oryza sativa subsp. japonica TaxID=39947 RepID=Q5NAA0_ORYSJ|nr:CREB-binding protein -like [Oryza sativa Japonica Group]